MKSARDQRTYPAHDLGAFIALIKVPGLTLVPFMSVIAAAFAPIALRDLSRVSQQHRRLVFLTLAAVGLGVAMRIWRELAGHGNAGLIATGSVALWVLSFSLVPGLLLNLTRRHNIRRVLGMTAAGAIVSTVIDYGTLPPWKGDLGAFATLLALALTIHRPNATRAVLIASAYLSATNDARGLTLFAVMAFIGSFVGPAIRQQVSDHPLRFTILGLGAGVGLVWAYYEAALNGLLGAEAQARTLINAQHGNAVLSARNEWAASIEVFHHGWWGQGLGVIVSPFTEAKAIQAVRLSGGDWTAPYWHDAVFAARHDFHSTLVNLWYHCGLGGLALTFMILWLILKLAVGGLAHVSSWGTLGLYASISAVWDVLFSPMAAQLNILVALFLSAAVSAGRAWFNDRTPTEYPDADQGRVPLTPSET